VGFVPLCEILAARAISLYGSGGYRAFSTMPISSALRLGIALSFSQWPLCPLWWNRFSVYGGVSETTPW